MDQGHPLAPQTLAAVARDLKATEGTDSVSLAALNSTGSTAVFGLVPQHGPNDEGTKQLATAVRAKSRDMSAAHGVPLGTTGFTALATDVSDSLADALPLHLLTVLGLSLVVLLLVFRCILVPVLATAGFLLSVAATFGATTAVFPWGWPQPLLGLDAATPVVSLLPVVVTGVLYGLAMDYQMFLVTSMREARVHGADPVGATVRGFAQAGAVVVAAATIMVAVFSAFIFNGQPVIKQLAPPPAPRPPVVPVPPDQAMSAWCRWACRRKSSPSRASSAAEQTRHTSGKSQLSQYQTCRLNADARAWTRSSKPASRTEADTAGYSVRITSAYSSSTRPARTSPPRTSHRTTGSRKRRSATACRSNSAAAWHTSRSRSASAAQSIRSNTVWIARWSCFSSPVRSDRCMVCVMGIPLGP
nr:MMPL family transporter [Streptomyces sp. A1-5]